MHAHVCKNKDVHAYTCMHTHMRTHLVRREGPLSCIFSLFVFHMHRAGTKMTVMAARCVRAWVFLFCENNTTVHTHTYAHTHLHTYTHTLLCIFSLFFTCIRAGTKGTVRVARRGHVFCFYHTTLVVVNALSARVTENKQLTLVREHIL